MLDQLVLVYLLHTPEVAPETRDWAVASANRRYGNYWRVVEDLLERTFDVSRRTNLREFEAAGS